MKKLIISLIAVVLLTLTACTDADHVNQQINNEANTFNRARQITVFNTRTDNVVFRMSGTMDISNNAHDELVVTVKVDKDKYRKHFIYLSADTSYIIEDITPFGSELVDYSLELYPVIDEFEKEYNRISED